MKRDDLLAALNKPLPDSANSVGNLDDFDPWNDIISGISGGYSSESDEIMLEVLEAIRDRTTFDLIAERGFIAEFMLYVLDGHGLTECGTSPRGSWPRHEIADLWDDLITKWRTFSEIAWGDDA